MFLIFDKNKKKKNVESCIFHLIKKRKKDVTKRKDWVLNNVKEYHFIRRALRSLKKKKSLLVKKRIYYLEVGPEG